MIDEQTISHFQLTVNHVVRRLNILCFVLVYVSLWGEGLFADDWPTFRHDLHRTGFTQEPLDVSRLNVAWQWRSSFMPQPAWAGPARWDAYAGIKGLPSMRSYDPVFHVASVGGRVLFGSTVDDSVYCLDAKEGRLLWRYTTDGPVRVSPFIDGGHVYFGSDDGNAYCVSLSKGDLRWKFGPDKVGKKVMHNGRRISLFPCRTGVNVKDGIAYFGCSMLPWEKSYLCAVDAQSGKVGEDGTYVKTFDQLTIEGPPAMTADWIVHPQGRVAPRIFQRHDGKDLGQIKKGGGGSIVIATLDDRVLHGPAIDTKKGGFGDSNVRSREVVARHGKGTAMVLAGNKSYVLGNNQLIATDFVSRRLLWKVPCRQVDSLIAVQDFLLAGGTDEVAAYHRRDGELVWRQKVEGRAHGLAAANGRLFVSTDVGAIYAFTTKETAAPTSPEVAVTIDAEATTAFKPAPIELRKDDRLLDHWVFQEPHLGEGTVENLARDLRAEVQGKLRLERAGRHQALALDGSNSSILVSDDHREAKLPTRDLTATAWVRIDKPTDWGGIVGAIQDNGDYERGWLLGYRGNKFAFALAASDGSGKLTYLTAPASFELGRWYHVAGSYDGEKMRLFVDGELTADSDSQHGDIDYPSVAYYELGAYHDKDEYFRMEGQLHEVRVYQTAIAAKEVASQFRGKRGHLPLLEKPIHVKSGPTLRFHSRGEATVTWETERPCSTLLKYETDSTVHELRQVESVTQHQVVLKDLKHKRVYRYRVGVQSGDGTRWTPDYECDTFFNFSLPELSSEAEPESGDHQTESAASLAKSAIASCDMDRGICVVLGVSDPRLLEQLLRQSHFRLIAVDTDQERVSRARAAMFKLGIYGSRVAIHHVSDFSSPSLPSRIANLVVCDALRLGDQWKVDAEEVHRLLRPDGGTAVLQLDESARTQTVVDAWQANLESTSKANYDAERGLLCIQRAALANAGEWSHLYGRPDNAAFGGEELAGAKSSADLQVQWIGRPGPRYQVDRNGRKPSPLSTGGRLFLQGDRRIVALDAYNGSVLWSLELPYLQRFNMPRDCGNWCADHDFVYVAMRDRCWKIDARSGKVQHRFGVVAPSASNRFDWGYVARVGDALVGSAVKKGTSWDNFWGNADAGWYDARQGEVTDKICSDSIFAREYKTGEERWTYSHGVIINSTITMADGRVWFVACRNSSVVSSAQRRVGMPELWQDRYLVALDIETGREFWQQPLDTPAGKVVYYLAHGNWTLVSVASADGKFHVDAFSASDGRHLWKQSQRWQGGKGDHGKAMSRPAIVGDKLFVRPYAMSLATGELAPKQMPTDGHGCGTYACTLNSLIFRADSVRMWDSESGDVSTWSRLRPDCWLSTIPAAGMLLSPEGGGGCSCGNWLETSIGFAPIGAR